MKMRSYGNTILFAGAFLLIGSLAVAQTPTAAQRSTGRDASSGHATGRVDQFPKASGATALPSGGHSTPSSAKSMGSAHATESLSASTPSSSAEDAKGSKQSNPMYKENGNSGENPLFEQKDSVAPKPKSGASPSVQYKDPEDMTTRYRPGNDKTSKIVVKTDGSGAPSPR